MSKLFQASVKENRQLTKNHYLITLHPLEKNAKPKPGQFFMLSVNLGADPLLRRPFSLHRWLGQDFQILYKVLGKLTHILKDKKTHDTLEIIGPLGNSFPVMGPKTKIILVAGGLGIAPIFALAETIVKLSCQSRNLVSTKENENLIPPNPPLVKGGRGDFKTKRKPLLFYGARTRHEVLCIDEVKSIGIDPVVSTDDGTLGQKGLITDVLRDFLSRHSSLPGLAPRSGAGVTRHCLYACGPKPMLKELSLLAKKFKLKGYIALEENMACGIGACLSCVVNTKKGFKRVCKEGPVFPIEEIVW